MTGSPVVVLHLIDTYRIGGPGKTIINSAKFIDPRFAIHVASFASTDETRNEFAHAVRAADIPYLPLVEVKRVDPSHVSRLRAYIRDHGVRILHTHGYRSDLLGWLAAVRTSGLSLVTTHHGWIRNSRRQKLTAGLGKGLSLLMDGVTCVSEPLLRELPGRLRRDGRAVVIHNGLVLDDYKPSGVRTEVRARIGVTDQDVLLGVIGRLSPEKGCEPMLEAFSLIAKTRPQVRLAFVGEGPMRPALEERAIALGLAGRVHFLGQWTPVQPIYETVDCVVSPSFTEGLSNVILESLAFGRPVVATAVGGNTEILDHEASGLLVAPGDPNALATAIARVIDDAGLRARLGTMGSQRVRDAFSFESRMRKEEAFYERVLASARQGRGAST